MTAYSDMIPSSAGTIVIHRHDLKLVPTDSFERAFDSGYDKKGPWELFLDGFRVFTVTCIRAEAYERVMSTFFLFKLLFFPCRHIRKPRIISISDNVRVFDRTFPTRISGFRCCRASSRRNGSPFAGNVSPSPPLATPIGTARRYIVILLYFVCNRVTLARVFVARDKKKTTKNSPYEAYKGLKTDKKKNSKKHEKNNGTIDKNGDRVRDFRTPFNITYIYIQHDATPVSQSSIRAHVHKKIYIHMCIEYTYI